MLTGQLPHSPPDRAPRGVLAGAAPSAQPVGRSSKLRRAPEWTGTQPTSISTTDSISGTTPAHAWKNYPDAFDAIIARLRGVVIENLDALDLMPQHDGDETVYYVDPPYVAETRDKGADYRHEMTDSDHERLAEALHGLTGAVVLSGYGCDLYDRLYAGWGRIERAAHADGARKRVEVLWLSKNCPAAGLFTAARAAGARPNERIVRCRPVRNNNGCVR